MDPPLLRQGIGVPVAFGGTGQPLPDMAVLDIVEQAAVAALVGANTAVVRDIAALHGLAVVEFGELMHDVFTQGVSEQGYTFTADFITGGAYSLDGVHPTCRFYGVVANRLIDAVNERYDAAVPHLTLGSLAGITFPK
jgi:hypothetical protein